MYLSPRAGKFRRQFTWCLNFLVVYPLSLVLLTFLSLICAPAIPIVWLLSKLFRPDLNGFVESEKSVFIQGEANNTPSNVLCLFILDGTLKVDSYVQHFQDRVLSLQSSTGKFIYEGFQYYATNFLGFSFWKKDENFDLKNHVRNYDFHEVKLPSRPMDSDLEKVVEKLVRAPWKENQSPWEVLFIHNYDGEKKTVKVFRFDHMLADGYSIIQFFRVLTQSEWRVPGVHLSGIKLSPLERMTIGYRIVKDLLFLGKQFWGQTKLPFQNESPQQELIFSMSPPIHVDIIKSIKKHFHVSYAAVCYAAVAGTIARALEQQGEKVPKEYVTNVILPRPNHPGGLCIHLTALVGKWPLRCSTPENRLQNVDKTLRALMNSTVLLLNNSQHKQVQLFPPCLIRPLYALGAKCVPTSVGFSTLPVMIGPDYYDGNKFCDLIVTTRPPLRTGIVVTIGGMDSRQRVSFCVNKNMFSLETIPRNLGAIFAEEIQRLSNATT